MGRFVPGFDGLKRGIDLIMFGKQSILPWANFYSSGAFGKVKWWKVALIGGGFSVMIETLQFVLRRGFTEFDDVFHNVVGAVTGYWVYVLGLLTWKMLRRNQIF